MLKAKGYLYSHSRGSHHVFKKPGKGHFTVPSHDMRWVKGGYVRLIEKLS